MSNVTPVAIARTRLCTHFIAIRRAIPRHQPHHTYVSRDDVDSVTSVTHSPLYRCVFESRSGGSGEKKTDEYTSLIYTDWFHSKIYRNVLAAYFMATESTEVAEPFVNPWHPNAIPPIDPSDPRIIKPTGEFGPDSYIDTGAYSHAKYPSFKKSVKRSKKKQDENGKKKKRSLKLNFSKIKKGMTETIID